MPNTLETQVRQLLRQAHEQGRHEAADRALREEDYRREVMCGIVADHLKLTASKWFRADSEAAHVLFDAEKRLRELGGQPHPMAPGPPTLPTLEEHDSPEPAGVATAAAILASAARAPGR